MNAASVELKARIHWALARIGEAVNAGRDAGWLAGPLLNVADSDGCLATNLETSPMRVLASRLNLSDAEHDVLWLLACIELEPSVSQAAQLLMAPGTHSLSLQMVERVVARDGLLDGDVFERLQRLALIETAFDPQVPLYRRAVRVHDRVLEIVRGRFDLDRTLRSLGTLESELDLHRTTQDMAIDVPTELARAIASQRQSLIVMIGTEGTGRSSVIRRAVASSGRSLIAVRCSELDRDMAMMSKQARAIARECRLHDAWPLFRGLDDLSDVNAFEREFSSAYDGPIFASAREPISWRAVPAVSLRISPLTPAQRTSIWRRRLPMVEAAVTEQCGAAYTVSPAMIVRAAESVTAAARSTIQVADIHDGLRAHLDRDLAGIATRIETRQTWNDLVLPVDQFDLLVELAARVRRRDQVLDQWGFADKVGRGIGTAALFSGPPGTGKTMIAGLIARELGLDLYQVDLSKIVSKYIGETEKQLAKLFDAAESGHAILLFDEADSLFAKRTEVKSSNDRYANLEVNYLLQRMEAFRGISLMTTNHEAAIDQAFMRRLAFHIRLPMPEEEEREKLWRAMMPAAAPVAEEVDFAALAQRFAMSGGYIRNAALRGAFMAADEGSSIATRHLECAARLEYEGMGKIAA